MPIPVVCPGCKARFAVSEKFAGKKGPCPKCKAVILVPEAIQEEVKIHVPEQFASGGKNAKGRAVNKPIARPQTKIQPVLLVAAGCAFVLALAIAALLRGLADKTPAILVGLLLISPPLAAAAYTFLRDDELMEPYRGRALALRAAICGLVYAALWGAYAPLPIYGIISGEPWQWVYVAPAFIAVGAAAAWACFDLDFGSGAMHYCFYVLMTLLLRAAIGLPALWTVTGSTAALPADALPQRLAARPVAQATRAPALDAGRGCVGGGLNRPSLLPHRTT
jgi:hypothetical protein